MSPPEELFGGPSKHRCQGKRKASIYCGCEQRGGGRPEPTQTPLGSQWRSPAARSRLHARGGRVRQLQQCLECCTHLETGKLSLRGLGTWSRAPQSAVEPLGWGHSSHIHTSPARHGSPSEAQPQELGSLHLSWDHGQAGTETATNHPELLGLLSCCPTQRRSQRQRWGGRPDGAAKPRWTDTGSLPAVVGTDQSQTAVDTQ